MQRYHLSGKDWYVEWEVITLLGCKNCKEFREKFGDKFTIFALSGKQRQELIDSRTVSKSVMRKGAFVACEEVDAHLQQTRSVAQPTLSSDDGDDSNQLLQLKDNQQLSMEGLATVDGPEDSDIATSNVSDVQNMEEAVSANCDNNFQSSVKLEPTECDHNVCCCNGKSLDSEPRGNSVEPTQNVLGIQQPGNARRKSDRPVVVKEEKKFICGSCPFFVEFPNQEMYLRHMDMAHVNNPSVVRTQGIMLPGANAQPSTQPSVTPSPKSENSARRGNRNSLPTTKTPKPFSCKICSMSFETEDGLAFHKNVTGHSYSVETDQQPEQRYYCIAEHCSVYFLQGLHLWEHVKRNHARSHFICDTCFEMFRYRDGLGLHLKKTRHQMGHLELPDKHVTIAQNSQNARDYQVEAKYACEKCGDDFSRPSELFEHSLTCGKPVLSGEDSAITSDENGKFSCRLCKKVFPSKDSRKRHEVMHVRHLRYKCHCGKSFSCYGTLWRHKKTHVATGFWACEFCSRTFRDQKVKEQHIDLFHRNDSSGATLPPKFSCDLCGKSFSNITSMRIHRSHHQRPGFQVKGPTMMKATAEEKPATNRPPGASQPCHICGRVFSINFLPEHISSHSGIRRFKCDRCDKLFMYSSALYKHKKSTCDRNDYKFHCDECLDVFKTKAAFKIHKNWHVENSARRGSPSHQMEAAERRKYHSLPSPSIHVQAPRQNNSHMVIDDLDDLPPPPLTLY